MEAQKWWGRIVNEDIERRKDRGESGSRQFCGVPATRAANGFNTFWLQSFAMVQARTQANSIDVWVRKSTPLVGYVTSGVRSRRLSAFGLEVDWPHSCCKSGWLGDTILSTFTLHVVSLSAL